MATLTVLRPNDLAATTLTMTAGTNSGDTFTNDGRTVVFIRCTNVVGRTITIHVPHKILLPTGDYLSMANVSFFMAQDTEVVAGPFPTRYFNSAAGEVTITYAGFGTLAAGMTLAAIAI